MSKLTLSLLAGASLVLAACGTTPLERGGSGAAIGGAAGALGAAATGGSVVGGAVLGGAAGAATGVLTTEEEIDLD